jgi:hypothetical protein
MIVVIDVSDVAVEKLLQMIEKDGRPGACVRVVCVPG